MFNIIAIILNRYITDYKSSSRFLIVFIYLNDNFEGGETEFSQLGVLVKPQQENMVMFPPMWAWWHNANKVTGNNPKYMVGTYMHYIYTK